MLPPPHKYGPPLPPLPRPLKYGVPQLPRPQVWLVHINSINIQTERPSVLLPLSAQSKLLPSCRLSAAQPFQHCSQHTL